MRKAPIFLFVALLGAFTLAAQRTPPRISEDRELKEYDLTDWDCLEKPSGTARSEDGIERNLLKNRSPIDLIGLKIPEFDTAGFLRHVAPLDEQTRGKRRSDLTLAERRQLEPLEKQIVSLTGYLVVAFSGPPESTNCASVDFHDWHLEIFEKPQDHPPRAGDPTPIQVEIAPRTQNDIYRAGIRLQQLAAFIRAPDLSYEPTGSKAARVRVTGYLLWDDDHNGRADVGPVIREAEENKYHRPWRSTAWEIHPVMKVEVIESDSAGN